MAELVWSKQDTHCLWCGKPKAPEAEWDRNHDDAKHDEDSCWCMEWCWGNCDEYITDRAVSGLRAEIEVLRGIVQRVKDGWQYVRLAALDQSRAGLWFRLQDDAGRFSMDAPLQHWRDEPMSPEEQRAIYGRVVREEEKSDAR